MPPRATRSNAANATPSRALRGSSPTASSMRSSDVRLLDSVRSPLVSKHSISYGSPLTQLPDRRSTVGDAKLASVAARVFKQVKKDNRTSKGRLYVDGQPVTGANKAPSPARSAPEDEVELVYNPDDDSPGNGIIGQNSGGDDADEVMGEAGEEVEEEVAEGLARESQLETRGKRSRRRKEDLEDGSPVGDEAPEQQSADTAARYERVKAATLTAKKASDMEVAKKEAIAARKAAREAAAMKAATGEGASTTRKRRRDDEAQAEEDLERIGREARQRRERLDEANRQAEERQTRQQESAQRLNTQPNIPTTGIATGNSRRPPATPFGASLGNLQPSVPNTARSWQEEGNLYGAASVSSSPPHDGDSPDIARKTNPPSAWNVVRQPPEPIMSGARNPPLPPHLQPPELLGQTRDAGRVDPGVFRAPEFEPNRPASGLGNEGHVSYLGPAPRMPLGSLKGVGKQSRNQPDWRHGGNFGGSHQDDATGVKPGKENGDADDSNSNSSPSEAPSEPSSDNGQDEYDSESQPTDDGGAPPDAPDVEETTPQETARQEWRWPKFKRISTPWKFTPWNLLKLIAIALIIIPTFQFLRSAVLPPPPILSDEQFDRLNGFLRDPSVLTPDARDNLKALLPRMIHVQRDRAGKLVIDNEFWHAIKARVQEDESILTLDDRSKLSERHWKALKDQFPIGTAPPVVQSWDSWLKLNEKKVINLVGRHFDNIIEEKLPSNVVSSEEFLRELQAGLAKQKKEMAGDLSDIKAMINSAIEDVTKLKSSANTPKGMAEAEVSKLVDKIVNKAIAKAQLKHAAKNNIGSATDPELQNRINHFAFGNGAAIEVSLTSPTFKMGRPRVGGSAWISNGKKSPQFIREGHAALTPWEEPGHCWCAAIIGVDNSTYPADVGVQTANLVIPEFIVLEHINPAETNDPEAMPKEVEVWAYIIEPQREKAKDWAVASFPRTYAELNRHDLMADTAGLVKIAEFTYKYEASTNGVFVKKLSEQLIEPLKAATDTILVRVRTNHGADHTCFYRIRMYGQNYDIFDFVQKPAEPEPQVFTDEEEDPWWKLW
ncbi:hypothetical protein B0T14DRAFT_138622 [Immersiella caudata]|uniref:SUN domain-containing protein n=1 Tax=Immersiella caudata TaxID=314043 RepID=A0AA40C7K3_9PEZI|nr:hypothetical protein B0T14DRAFT_138622 [Immersiella caudata]